jgi:two-component system chemotaxis response regulator CheY
MAETILVVDDSPSVRSLETLILKTGGFQVDQAANGVEALEKIYKGQYALVITDVNMPKMDGLALTKALREQEVYKQLPVIMMTSEAEEKDRSIGVESGANVYLVKPATPDKLLLNVRMLLAK